MAAILLADDMPAVRRAIATLLRRAGHEVTEVADGQAALEAARAERFDLVVADVIMPRLDGIEVLRALREEGPARPRLLAISGGTGGITGSEALRVAEVTADAVLTKPFENAELLAAVDRLLALPAAGRA
jgi:CheY-like chemotaxis protein